MSEATILRIRVSRLVRLEDEPVTIRSLLVTFSSRGFEKACCWIWGFPFVQDYDDTYDGTYDDGYCTFVYFTSAMMDNLYVHRMSNWLSELEVLEGIALLNSENTNQEPISLCVCLPALLGM